MYGIPEVNSHRFLSGSHSTHTSQGSHLTHRIAINGYGRIGRSFLRSLHESDLLNQLAVVHINEPADIDSIVYLTRFDSTHGRFPGMVQRRGNDLIIGDAPISISHALLPQNVDWKSLGIDLVVECSGKYGRRAELNEFIGTGVPRLLLSHPGNSEFDVDKTIIFGTNHHTLTGTERLISNASCTANAVVPVLDLLNKEFGIEKVLLTILHSVMNDQPLVDSYHHSDFRRTRSAMQSMIPISTGLTRGIERMLPMFIGKVQANAIRVPTINVSAIDLVVQLKKCGSVAAVNRLFKEAASGPWIKIVAYTEDPHASIDFNHDPHSAIIDGSQTRVVDNLLIKLLIWFDNEWGYANRMVDVATHWLSKTTNRR
jgi:glyceraldehyde 3-phosphate dehydrogenase/D-erythrose 4-phosphate dehydrogenase